MIDRTKVCHCIHKAQFGQRWFWLECLLGSNHDGRHWDLKRDYLWDGPVVYWDDYEQGTEATNRKRVSKRCVVCHLYPCCCQKEAENHVGQKDMFREDVVYKANVEFCEYIDYVARGGYFGEW